MSDRAYGALTLFRHYVRQRRLDDLPRMVGLLRRPVPERRPEALSTATPRSARRPASETPDRRRRASSRHRGSPHPAAEPGSGAHASPSSAPRYYPHPPGDVHLVPRRLPHLGGPLRGQHQELECQPDRRRGRVRRSAPSQPPRPPPSEPRVPPSEEAPACAAHDVPCGPSTGPIRSHGLSRLHPRDRPLQHRADALTDGPGCLRLGFSASRSLPDRASLRWRGPARGLRRAGRAPRRRVRVRGGVRGGRATALSSECRSAGRTGTSRFRPLPPAVVAGLAALP